MATAKYMPDELYPSSMEVNLEFNHFVFTSPANGREQVEERPGERWTFKFSYKDLDQIEAKRLQAFLVSLNGVVGRFYAKDYAFFERRGEMRGTPQVDGASNTGHSLRIKNCPSNRKVLYDGDYIKVAGRLYMVTDLVQSDGSGNATVNVMPRIWVPPADGTTVEYDNFTVTCRLSDNRQAKRASRDMSNDFAFEAIEIL